MSQISIAPTTANESGRDPILEVRGLRVHFSKESGLIIKKRSTVKAVDDISFDIYPGEFVTIVGETGSGKTTVARCLMGLTRSHDCSIKYKGKEISDMRGKERIDHWRRVQMVFQDPYESLNPMQNVFKIISTPMRLLTKESNPARLREKVASLLAEVGLDASEVMNRFPHQLSGGQRQRVNIARALAPGPELLIADEPITMLDAEQRLNILFLLKELKQKRNLTVLMITHDLASAQISDRMLIMYLGKLVETGPSRELVSAPHHPYVELIMESAPNLNFNKTILNANPLATDDNPVPEKGCVYQPRCKYATRECSETTPKLEEFSKGRFVACYNPLNTKAA